MIKSKIDIHLKPKEKEYPYLGYFAGSGQVVLFTGKNTGTLVWSDTDKNIGYWSDKWSEGLYSIYKGNLSLTNNWAE